MSDEQINLKVKQTSNNTTFDISISKSASVIELKKACSEHTKLTEKEQNLVYKGRILADDKNLSDYNVQNDHTIILVKKFVEKEEKQEPKTTGTTTTTQQLGQSTSTTSTNQQNQNVDPFSMFGGLGGNMGNMGGMGGLGGLGGLGGMGGVDPSQLGSMLNNPQYMQMMNEMLSDPNTMNMIMNSPQLKPLLDSNPHLRQMMQNPQMMQMMLNPQNLQNALNMMGGGMGGGLGGLGGSGTGSNPFAGNMPGFSNYII
jgi:ubiquilin